MMTATSVPSLLTTRFQQMSVSRRSYPALMKQDLHAHTYTNITFIVSGSLSETVGTRVEWARPLSIVIKPEGTKHVNQFGPGGAVTLSVRLDQSFTRALQDWQKDLNQWRWQHCGSATKWFLRLMQSLQGREIEARAEIENHLYEMLAVLSTTPTLKPANFPCWLRLVKQQIDDDVENCGRVADLAARAGVHPVYLARQFRSYLAVSVSEYVKQSRLVTTAQLLSASRLSLASIAAQAGFSDQSHMGRRLKSTIGLTPHKYRRLVSNIL